VERIEKFVPYLDDLFDTVLSFQARYGDYAEMNRRVGEIEKQNTDLKEMLKNNDETLKILSLKLDENSKVLNKNISNLESKLKK